MNDLVHFSAKPIKDIHDVAQDSGAGVKPNGLWVSVGEAWAEWCLGESFATSRLACISRITLADDARICRVTGAAALDRFTRRYGQRPSWMTDDFPFYKGVTDHDIRWCDVASEYDGIVIAPYVWSRRFDLRWYYGWDVASGCIWNAKAIAGVECVGLSEGMERSA